MLRPADIGFLRRAAAGVGFRNREGLTLSHKLAPNVWEQLYRRQGSVFENPLVAYQPQEGTPDMMVVDVGTSAVADIDAPCFTHQRAVRTGDLVRATNAVQESTGLLGAIGKAVRAGTIGMVEQLSSSSSAVITWTGYFDHPLGLPMVMERADGARWHAERQARGPVRRILASGEVAGPEQGFLHATSIGTDGASWPAVATPLSLRHVRDLSAGVTLEAPLHSLEVSNGHAWQPLCAAAAKRRQAMAAVHAAGLPFLRRVSEGRKSGTNPLLGWGHGEGFLRPGADTSMVHDAPVLAYDGTGVGREFNLLYIDEEAEYAVVGMGSASGALYSTGVSLRMLPLADVYLPFTKLISPSLPLSRLLDGAIGNALSRLHGPPDGGRPSLRVDFLYHGRPLPPGDSSLWASVRSLFVRQPFDGNESAAHAWERLRTELVERQGKEAVQRVVEESGTIMLPLDLFCVSVDGHRQPVYLDLVARV